MTVRVSRQIANIEPQKYTKSPKVTSYTPASLPGSSAGVKGKEDVKSKYDAPTSLKDTNYYQSSYTDTSAVSDEQIQKALAATREPSDADTNAASGKGATAETVASSSANNTTDVDDTDKDVAAIKEKLMADIHAEMEAQDAARLAEMNASMQAEMDASIQAEMNSVQDDAYADMANQLREQTLASMESSFCSIAGSTCLTLL